jgi:hypothetical protein
VEVLRYRVLVKNEITEDEFEWIKTRIMEAALFSVLQKLEHDPIVPAQKDHLDLTLKQLFILSRVKELDEEGNLIDHSQERLAPLLAGIPRTNLILFLDNYKRIHYSAVHFDRPTEIEFDREQILRAAQNNPP